MNVTILRRSSALVVVPLQSGRGPQGPRREALGMRVADVVHAAPRDPRRARDGPAPTTDAREPRHHLRGPLQKRRVALNSPGGGERHHWTGSGSGEPRIRARKPQRASAQELDLGTAITPPATGPPSPARRGATAPHRKRRVDVHSHPSDRTAARSRRRARRGTYGMHAEPTTFGIKLAGFAMGLTRRRRYRLRSW